MGIPSLYEGPDAARAAPKLSDGPRAFHNFDLRYGLVADRGPKASRILAVLFVAMLGLVAAGWLAGWLELPDLP